MIGNNLKTHLEHLEKRMRDAAADLDFETAARLRDEIKRLRETELAISDDPLAREVEVLSPVSGREKGKHNKGRARHRTVDQAPRALFAKPDRSTRWAAPATMRRRRARFRARCSRSSRSDEAHGSDFGMPGEGSHAVPQERSRRDDRAADRKAARSRAGAPGGGRRGQAGPARTVGPRQL